MTTTSVKEQQLIQPIEHNLNGIKTVTLELPSARPFHRRVRLALTSGHLSASLYTSGHASATFTSRLLSEWHLNVGRDGDMALWCGPTAYGLSLREGNSIRAWLEPLGLAITRYA